MGEEHFVNLLLFEHDLSWDLKEKSGLFLDRVLCWVLSFAIWRRQPKYINMVAHVY